MFNKKSPWLRYALILAAVLAVGIAVKLVFFPKAEKPNFITAAAAPADLEQAVLATGTLQAFKQVSVGSQVSGQVKSLKVALGDKVTKGQLVAEIDSLTQANNLRNTQAALANVQAQLLAKQAALKQNELTFKREQEMLASDASSRATFEAAEAALNTARADVNATQAQIAQAKIAADTAQINLGYTKILAPMDGVVVALVAQEGQTVNANQSTPTIIKLATLDTITVKAQISEADVVRVKPGQKVYFTILGAPDKRYYTTLRTVEPAPDSILTDTTTSTSSSAATAIYYNGLLDVPNPDGRLRISMTAQVYIVLSEAKQALSIPSSALGDTDRQGLTTVRVVNAEGKAQPRQVKVGINNNVRAQILEGLQAGDKVVVSEAPAPGSPPAQTRRPPGGMRL
ncbi:efflux transporter periplasmic adaptor subunit [Rhodoferax koreense]|uniref:Efflux transporter periplasmic adaptor subunit n=1 Tax=Rhodoferax koreensis TaxID=1842727 RepID=A0A1P8K2K8_9BURK|nr:efflux RND transporter periplasmic adaptor subunit [Rhodoferax koreense]APW40248.1 efflux transporter periplasmic adaptor subunit [Rhodoferax koreense]